MSKTLCPICGGDWNLKDPSACIYFIPETALDMLRRAGLSIPPHDYDCVEVNSTDGLQWINLEQLGLARGSGGVLVNQGSHQYFHRTPDGRAYIKWMHCSIVYKSKGETRCDHE